VIFAHFVFFAIPNMILYRLGIFNNHAKKFRLRRIITLPRIWIGEYVLPMGSTSNVLVIQGNDGGLLLRSPPEPTPAVVQAIRDLGEPTALLLTLSHDAFADKWKEMFPLARVIAPRNDIPAINNRVRVDLAIEDAREVLENFHIIQTISTSEWTRLEDFALVIQLHPPQRLAVSFNCGVSNTVEPMSSLSYWRNLLLGRNGLGVPRTFAYLFARNPEKAQQMWHEISQIDGLYALFFLHGEPIIGGDVKSMMSNVNLTKMRLTT